MPQQPHDPCAVIYDLMHVDVSEHTSTFIHAMLDDIHTVLRPAYAQLESRGPAHPGAHSLHTSIEILVKQFEHFLLGAHLAELHDPVSLHNGDLPPTRLEHPASGQAPEADGPGSLDIKAPSAH